MFDVDFNRTQEKPNTTLPIKPTQTTPPTNQPHQKRCGEKNREWREKRTVMSGRKVELGRVGRKCKGHWVDGVENPIKTKQTHTNQTKNNHTRWRGRKEESPEMDREYRKNRE